MNSAVKWSVHSTLLEFGAAIGAENVLVDEASIGAAQTATFETSQSIPFILKPADRGQVQACLRIANRVGIPVYPISSGKNWGYGSKVPVASGCALLDLSRMAAIVDYSEEHGYVTVEPGVTQQDLYRFLRDRNSPYWMDATGSSPSCSLIGNAAERGFGHTPYGDHFSHVCNLEVILPTGECIQTGFGRFPGAAAAPLYRWGVGPSVDGLFSQSNFGIITRMTIWLMPRPEYFQAFFFRCDTEDLFAGAVDALRPLRMNGTLRSAVHIGNDYKVLAGIQRFPWDVTGGATPLRPEHMAALRKQLNFGWWNGSGALYGTPVQVAESKRLLRRALAGKVSKLNFLDEKLMGLAQRFARVYQAATGWDIRRTIELAKPVFGLMSGTPTPKTLPSTYWRKRGRFPSEDNPDRDRCGLLWAAPVLPIDGKRALAFSRDINSLVLDHGFEPSVSMTLLTERSLSCIISIAYDRDVPGEDGRAMACYRQLLQLAHSQGYYSYRLGIQSMAAEEPGSSYDQFLEKLKAAIDPNGVLAPGRYQPLYQTESVPTTGAFSA